MIILGTDEAGYGPNLGPLVVSLTTWKTSAENLSHLFEPLKKKGILIGDSKKLYHSQTHKNSLKVLETGVLVPLRSLKKHIVPIANNEQLLNNLFNDFTAVLCEYQTQLLDMQFRSVEPAEFNQLLDQYGSKGSLLSDITLRLIADQMMKLKQTEKEPQILVLCDKHGGRNHYLDLLTFFFPGEFIQTVQESRESSIYRLISESKQWEFRFLAKGESHLPIALASMLSKYHRELAMIRLNDFWQTHVSGLRPTAGYPEDAKRFKKEIAAAQTKLGISDDDLWRKR